MVVQLISPLCFFFNSFKSIKYEVGDVVELLPSQDSSAIDAFIERCDLDPESFITVSSSTLLT